LTGADWRVLIHPDDMATVLAHIDDPVAMQRGKPIVMRVRHSDGSYRVMETQFTAQLDNPAVAGIVGNLRDITYRQKLERELRQAQRLESVGQLASGIAHEINTPIQFVGDNVRFLSDAFGELLERTGPHSDDPEAEFLAEEIPTAISQTLDGVQRVSTIVRAMKAFGHPGHDSVAPTDLNEAIRNTVVVASNSVKHVADVTLDLGELPLVRCHSGDINQMLLNLVINAGDAIAEKVGDTGQRGALTVRTSQDGADAVIEVSDTGVGIPERFRSRVFEQFFTTKEIGRGTGQGLAMAYAIVTTRHNGSITFESEPGVGTVFTVRLPIR
jgi:signal transduction histidine kinase